MATKAEINLVRSLTSRSARQQAGLFVAEGAKLAGELAASGLRVRKVFHTGECDLSGECEQIAPREMERMSHLKTPSDVLALVELPSWKPDLKAIAGGLSIALDGVQDPGNLGTIIRLADWFGIRDVLCSADSADCFNPKVVQATMGAIARVRVHYLDLPQVLGTLKIPVYGTFLEGEDIYKADLTPAGVILMGSEGRGISPEAAKTVTRRLFIPPYPRGAQTSESLNVAMATAIVCSELRRR